MVLLKEQAGGIVYLTRNDIVLKISLNLGTDRGEFISLADKLFQDGVGGGDFADVLSRREHLGEGMPLATYLLKTLNDGITFLCNSFDLDTCQHKAGDNEDTMRWITIPTLR